MKFHLIPIIAAVCLSWNISHAASPWDVEALKTAPKFVEDPLRDQDGVKAIFYDGLPWKGRPTRVFAYYGAPKVEAGKKVPAMVLVHGGGGSAFVPWVKLWVSRGYAAIAMDTCGAISNGTGGGNHPRHNFGGPPGWGGLDQIDEPVTDQWAYHAVADVILANSLIRSFPEVDAEKIGLTGISWGGYLTCITAGVDDRFQFAAPVYGCGFLDSGSHWMDRFEKMGPEKTKRWVDLWEPKNYLVNIKMPMLWVTGTNDFAFPMDSLQKSYRSTKGDRFLAIRPRMPHGHGGAGENPEEIHAMADAILKGGVPLAKATLNPRDGKKVSATFDSKSPIISAELNYTTDTGAWKERVWKALPATLDAKSGKVFAELPEGVSVYYFNIIDERNLYLCSEHEEL